MGRAIFVLAAILDLGLAALLIALSGFVFGPGPESMHADPAAMALWAGMLAGSVAAPLAGLALYTRQRPCCACMLAWLPPVVTLAAVVLAPPY